MVGGKGRYISSILMRFIRIYAIVIGSTDVLLLHRRHALCWLGFGRFVMFVSRCVLFQCPVTVSCVFTMSSWWPADCAGGKSSRLLCNEHMTEASTLSAQGISTSLVFCDSASPLTGWKSSRCGRTAEKPHHECSESFVCILSAFEARYTSPWLYTTSFLHVKDSVEVR